MTMVYGTIAHNLESCCIMYWFQLNEWVATQFSYYNEKIVIMLCISQQCSYRNIHFPNTIGILAQCYIFCKYLDNGIECSLLKCIIISLLSICNFSILLYLYAAEDIQNISLSRQIILENENCSWVNTSLCTVNLYCPKQIWPPPKMAGLFACNGSNVLWLLRAYVHRYLINSRYVWLVVP